MSARDRLVEASCRLAELRRLAELKAEQVAKVVAKARD
jgi:hypothetical protein